VLDWVESLRGSVRDDLWTGGREPAGGRSWTGRDSVASKLVLFDIETTNLNANFGICLCVAWKVLGERAVHSVSIDQSPTFDKDTTNDKYVVTTAAKALSAADIVCGWYSSKFDWPFLQTRLLAHKQKVMPPVSHLDAWRIAKYQMRMNSNRLATVSEFLGVEEKTKLSGPLWIKAAAGNRQAIRYVVKHCRQDVVVLEEVYERIRPLCRTHPNMSAVKPVEGGCPICGVEGKLQESGYHIGPVRRYQRYRCRACRGWVRGDIVKKKV
jgi:DNA polymerase elongation subunit (family B)